jgi:RNA polymerase sigma factor (sigma-70 family)
VNARPLFADFYRRHYPILVRAVTAWTGDRYLAEDVSQDVMVVLRRYYDRYDRPEILMYRMARQQLGRRRQPLVEIAGGDGVGDVPVPATTLCDVEERMDVLALARRLPRRQCEVIVLVVICDLSVEDAAQVLGISASAVKTHKARGIEALRAFLAGTSAAPQQAAEPSGGATT